MKDSPPTVFVFSPASAAQATPFSVRTIMAAIATGRLVSYKVGRRRAIFPTDLEAWVRAGGNAGSRPSAADTNRDQLAEPRDPSAGLVSERPASSE